MKTFNIFFFVPSLTASLQPCNSHRCQNKHTDKQPKANTLTHTINRDMSSSPLSYILPPKTGVPHIATNISHELSATRPSWIFIKQNSKQIDFTPAALLHFYLILFLSQMLTYSSLPLPQFHCSILSPPLSFLMLFLLPLCISCLLSLLFILPSSLSHSPSSAFHFLHFLQTHFPASPDLCSWICGPEETCCWWVNELYFDCLYFYVFAVICLHEFVRIVFFFYCVIKAIG